MRLDEDTDVLPKTLGPVRRAQLQRNREWERQYAEAREAKRAGGDPLFPHGTYWLRLHAGARVANAPPAG